MDMFRVLLAILLLIPTNGWCVTQWNKAIPASGDTKSSWPGQVTAQWSIMDTLLSTYRQGENVIYKNATTLTVTLGQIVVSNAGGSLRIFLNDSGNTDITTANLDTGGSFSAGTTYYVYAAATSSTAASSTYYISLSSSAPTGPTYYVQLGNFTTDGSANVVASAIVNNNASINVQTQGSTVYSKANVNLGGNSVTNGKLGEESCTTVAQSNNTDNYCPTGCYVRGQHRDNDGSAGSLYCCCP